MMFGVRELLRLHRFPLQRDQRLRVVAEFVRQDLDRNPGVTVERLFLAQIARLVDDAHAAAAQFLLEPESILDE